MQQKILSFRLSTPGQQEVKKFGAGEAGRASDCTFISPLEQTAIILELNNLVRPQDSIDWTIMLGAKLVTSKEVLRA
jgi:hypothetical protein